MDREREEKIINKRERCLLGEREKGIRDSIETCWTLVKCSRCAAKEGVGGGEAKQTRVMLTMSKADAHSDHDRMCALACSAPCHLRLGRFYLEILSPSSSQVSQVSICHQPCLNLKIISNQ